MKKTIVIGSGFGGIGTLSERERSDARRATTIGAGRSPVRGNTARTARRLGAGQHERVC